MDFDNNLQDFSKNDSFDDWYSSDITSTTDMPQQFTPQKKRHYAGQQYYGEPPAKKSAPSIRLGAGFKWNLQALANAADAVESGGKSPVSALNELGVRVNYSVLQQGGPAHCPSFTVAVTVADMTFEGWGHSKREARASAARACLAALLARAGRVLPAPGARQNQDFTSDEPGKEPVSDFQCLEVKMKPPPSVASVKSSDTSPEGTPPPAPCPATALFGASNAATVHKSPINVLYENYPGLSFTCTFGDGEPLDSCQAPLQLSHSMRFKVVCTIKDQKFEGYGSSKKLAKLAAARSALAVLDEGRAESPPAAAMAGFLPQTLADRVGKLVNEKFNEVMKGDLVHSKRKVLAGIVITINNRTEDARVIAVTTGTKCVSGEHMSVRGRVLNDCHAEVAARRCLQRHLYAQLLMYASAEDPKVTIPESDLEPLPTGGYQLKPDRQVHLYVSTAPCGDGRIFSPHEQPQPEPDRHPNRLARGQLRTKIESGEGTIPVKNCNNVVQTWDGVMQGERLLTMSCSDKVARWCVVGLQGALLSRIMKPVYLHSLVLGSLLHPHHMYRALCGRIEAYISSLPPPFQLQRPLLARAASTEARTPARAPSFSVCWCCTTQLPEVVNATTGKLESGQPSLLCKQSMFARWQYLVKRLPLLPQENNIGIEPVKMPEDLDHLLYNEAKQLCPTYQVAKERLIDAFDKAKLGRWVKKPLEQDQFVCEVASAPAHALFAWAGPALSAPHAAPQPAPGHGCRRSGDENGLKDWDESGEGMKSRDDSEKRLDCWDESDEGLKNRDEEKRLKCWDESDEGLKCWDDSIMPSKNGDRSEKGLNNWGGSRTKEKCRDEIGEKRFGVEYSDVGKKIISQNSCKGDENNDNQSNHLKGKLKSTVGDRLFRYALRLQDEHRCRSNEANQRSSKDYDNSFTKFLGTDGINKLNENKNQREPKIIYFIKDNIRKTINLEDKIDKNNEFIKTKKLKTDLNNDDCQSIDVVRVTETFKIRLNRNSEQLTGIADVYTNFKNDPLNFDTETLQNEMDEIYRSVFGEKETEIKNDVIRQEDVDLSDSVSVEINCNEKYNTNEDQRVSNSSCNATTNSILSDNISNDCSQKRSLHLNYLMTRLKNIKLQNESNLTNTNRNETEFKIHLESEKSDLGIDSQMDSKSSIHKILLYDSKVRSNKLNMLQRFPPTNTVNENESKYSNIHHLVNISTPNNLNFPQESPTQLDSKLNQESILKSDSKSQESNSKLQESNCNTSDESHINARSKLLMKKLQMLKNIKDVT